MQNQRYGLNQTTYHTHKGGIGGPRINSADLIPGRKTSGSVTMASAKDYKFNVNFVPNLVLFYGTIADGTPGTGFRTITIGQAAMGQNLYFQPQSTSAVTIGGKPEIVQSCSSLVINGTGNGQVHYAPVGETHLVDVWTTDANSPIARATLSSYGQNFFTVTVDTLASGYTIVGNFFVS